MSGDVSPSLRTLEAIAEVLGVRVSDRVKEEASDPHV
jgi:hypothetical protein